VEREGGGIELPHIITLKKSMNTNLDASAGMYLGDMVEKRAPY
jgi:hypothetical protein